MFKGKFATRPVATETTRASRPAAAGAEAVADDEDGAGSKKRKREEPDKSDPKLQEYLRVMRSGKESLGADETAVDSDSLLAPTGSAVVADGESDDEYVEVPSRKEKQRKVDHPTKSGQVESQASSKRDLSSHSQVSTAQPPGMVAESTEPPQADQTQSIAVATEATDDDWLRSRTNRLLDLVDPDDLPGTAVGDQTGQPVGEVVGNDNDNLHSEEDGSDDVENVVPQEDPGKQDNDSSMDAISRTSRLFVRNLAYSATEDDIQEAFAKFGDLQEVSFSARSLFRFMFVCFYPLWDPKKTKHQNSAFA